MYIGGTDFVLQLDMNDYHVKEVGEHFLLIFLNFLYFITCSRLDALLYLLCRLMFKWCALSVVSVSAAAHNHVTVVYQMVATAQLFSAPTDRCSFSAIFGLLIKTDGEQTQPTDPACTVHCFPSCSSLRWYSSDDARQLCDLTFIHLLVIKDLYGMGYWLLSIKLELRR